MYFTHTAYDYRFLPKILHLSIIPQLLKKSPNPLFFLSTTYPQPKKYYYKLLGKAQKNPLIMKVKKVGKGHFPVPQFKRTELPRRRWNAGSVWNKLLNTEKLTTFLNLSLISSTIIMLAD